MEDEMHLASRGIKPRMKSPRCLGPPNGGSIQKGSSGRAEWRRRRQEVVTVRVVQPTHKVWPITTQDVSLVGVKAPRIPRAAALKSYLLYRPALSRGRPLPPLWSLPATIIAASYYVGSFSVRRPERSRSCPIRVTRDVIRTAVPQL